MLQATSWSLTAWHDLAPPRLDECLECGRGQGPGFRASFRALCFRKFNLAKQMLFLFFAEKRHFVKRASSGGTSFGTAISRRFSSNCSKSGIEAKISPPGSDRQTRDVEYNPRADRAAASPGFH